MTTSGSYDASTTGYLIVKDAYVLNGMVDEDEPLTGDQWVKGVRVLNEMMSVFSTHKGLWLVDDITVTLTPGTESYSISVGGTIDNPTPMRISHARTVYSLHEVSMDVMAREDYMSIPNKSLQAVPLSIYYDKGHGKLYVWPTGTSSNKTIKITAQRPVQDFDSQGDTPDFPKEWVLAIKYSLAELLAPSGSVPSQISEKAAQLLSAVVRYDEEETSIFIR